MLIGGVNIVIKPYSLGRRKGLRTYLNGTPVSRKPVSEDIALKQADALKKTGMGGKIKSYALSETDIREIIPTLKIIAYPDLLGATSIDDVLDEKGRLMLLYLTTSKSNGHWVCLLRPRKTPGIIEYFDPYGKYEPDEESEWLSKQELNEFGQSTFHLSKLLESSPYKIIYNTYPFQKLKRDNNTCGRHCTCRLYFKHLNIDEYTDMIIKSGIPSDDFVMGFTYNMIGK